MKKVAVAFALVIASIALVACGSSSSTTSSSGSEATQAETTAESGAAGGGKEAKGGTSGSAASLDIEAASSGLSPDEIRRLVEEEQTAVNGKRRK